MLKDLGLTLVADEIYTPPLADATSIVQKLRSGKPDFVLMQSTNVGDDKLLVEKFAEFGLNAKKMPLLGNGGHWCVPELLKLTGAGERRRPDRRTRQLAGQDRRRCRASASSSAPGNHGSAMTRSSLMRM